MTVAAAPAWFADHVAPVTLVVLLLLAAVVIRFVGQIMLRLTLLGLIVAVAVLVYVNRDPLQACARTCECQIGDRTITVPLCDPDVDL